MRIKYKVRGERGKARKNKYNINKWNRRGQHEGKKNSKMKWHCKEKKRGKGDKE